MRKFLWIFVLIFVAGSAYLLLRNKSDKTLEQPVETGEEVEVSEGDEKSEPVAIEENTEMYEIDLTAPGGLPKTVREKIISDYEAMLGNFRDNANSMSDLSEFPARLWLKTEEAKEYSGENTRSLEIVVSDNSGGAHPNAVYLTYTYSPDGTILSLGDILKNDSEKLKTVRSVSEEKLLTKFYADMQENLKNESDEAKTEQKEFIDGMVKGGVDAVDFSYSTWVINGKNLVMIFPPYSVAPYAYGTQEVSIPLADL